jgi:hypothetical protein
MARLLAIGYGSQMLVSETAAMLARDVLPSETKLRDVGEHYLPDLLKPECLFQTPAPRPPGDFPPLRSLAGRLHTLPHHPTAFLGRRNSVSRRRSASENTESAATFCQGLFMTEGGIAQRGPRSASRIAGLATYPSCWTSARSCGSRECRGSRNRSRLRSCTVRSSRSSHSRQRSVGQPSNSTPGQCR